MVLPEFRVPGPKFKSELPVTVSVPLIPKPAFAPTPPLPPMLEVPDAVKGPSRFKLPVALVRVALLRVRALRNTELMATVSEVGAEVLESNILLAAVKLWTDCTLFARVTVVPANGVSMQTSSVSTGRTPVLQFAAVVHCPSFALPVH